jgi:hypothetical protein
MGEDVMVRCRFTNARGAARLAAAGCLAAAATPASASFLSGEALDTAATVIAWVVICVVPIVCIVLFWLVHVLPEKIAEKRHHPQKDAIHTLCLLSLAFGGCCADRALWAYNCRSAIGRLRYREAHDNYYLDMGKGQSGRCCRRTPSILGRARCDGPRDASRDTQGAAKRADALRSSPGWRESRSRVMDILLLDLLVLRLADLHQVQVAAGNTTSQVTVVINRSSRWRHDPDALTVALPRTTCGS